MCSRLEMLITAALPYFPVAPIKSTNYFSACISGPSFHALKFLKESNLKKKKDWFGEFVSF